MNVCDVNNPSFSDIVLEKAPGLGYNVQCSCVPISGDICYLLRYQICGDPEAISLVVVEPMWFTLMTTPDFSPFPNPDNEAKSGFANLTTRPQLEHVRLEE